MKPRINPVSRESRHELEDIFQATEATLGFVPNSFFAMARRPAVLRAFVEMARTVLGPSSSISAELQRLVAHAVSRGSGCRYSTVHSAHRAVEVDGVPLTKVLGCADIDASPALDDAERAAIRVAFQAGKGTDLVTGAEFDALRTHFDDDQVADIMAIIAFMGWLNRWNDTLATPLEPEALTFGEKHLGGVGWLPGKHAS